MSASRVRAWWVVLGALGGCRVDVVIVVGGDASAGDATAAPGDAPADDGVEEAAVDARGVVDGVAMTADVATPEAAVEVTGAVRALAVGDAAVCALLATGVVRCRGSNRLGQLGEGTGAPARGEVEVVGVRDLRALGGGPGYLCGVQQGGGAVWCWGDNTRGECGFGSGGPLLQPRELRNVDTAWSLSAGARHACALDQGRLAWCWGDDSDGQRGDGDRVATALPSRVAGLSMLSQVVAGARGTCALKGEAEVSCWGAVPGSAEPSSVPTVRRGYGPAVQMALGATQLCLLDAGGVVRCAGDNERGSLGDGTRRPSDAPVRVVGLRDVRSLRTAPGAGHTCALDRSGGVWCWGANDHGQLGDGTAVDRDVPARVALPGPAAEVYAGSAATCAALVDAVWCWGANVDDAMGWGEATVRALRPRVLPWLP